jgi:hypothetical protein
MPEIGNFEGLVDQLKADTSTRQSVTKVIDAVKARVAVAETPQERHALVEGLTAYEGRLVDAALHDRPPTTEASNPPKSSR